MPFDTRTTPTDLNGVGGNLGWSRTNFIMDRTKSHFGLDLWVFSHQWKEEEIGFVLSIVSLCRLV
jgi:hypothetical protein